MKRIAGLLVLLLVLAACDSTPPTPTLQDRANATKTAAEAAAVRSDAADKAKIAQASADAVRQKASSEALVAQANAALANQQAENEKLLAQTKAAGDKALADATAYGQAYRDRVEANKTALAAYNDSVKSAIETNLTIAQDNLRRQQDEEFSLGLRIFLYQVKPWFIFILVLLFTQFVVSVGEYWWARIHAGQPRVLQQPTTVNLILSKYLGLPLTWAYFIAGFIFGWQMWQTRQGWQSKTLHDPATLKLLAKSEAGRRLVEGALRQMSALSPGLADRAAETIREAGSNAVNLLEERQKE
ncbi:MAG: hypothetical protein M1352_00340 [Patescibacteria group bacterium]|nr:hypothetical protein [Patescibacteria group bacterium]